MRKTLAGLALAACLFAPSCLGPNVLFQGLRDWNTQVTDSRIVNELIYLGLTIIPVYGIFLVVDDLILNSLQWWNLTKEPIIEWKEEYQPQGELDF